MIKQLLPIMNRRLFCAAVCAAAIGTGSLQAQERSDAVEQDDDSTIDAGTRTRGGKQFWSDVWFFHEWHIQRNVFTGHCRLLDGKNRRHAWGSLTTCRAALDAIRKRDQLPAMQGKGVVVLHGLFRTRSSMQPLCDALAEGGYSTFNVGYPSTRGNVGDHAQALESVIQSLEGISEINFVAHSLGNLVVRHWLHDRADAKRELPAGQRFGRMVMLAPPNHRPQLATTLLQEQPVKRLAGRSAQELAEDWETLEPRLATPTFEFGILAGGRGDNLGFNPLIPGDDDAVVSVQSTRLAGARDYRRLRVMHTFIMNDPSVRKFTLRFLADGYFESDRTRQPISAETAGQPDGQ